MAKKAFDKLSDCNDLCSAREWWENADIVGPKENIIVTGLLNQIQNGTVDMSQIHSELVDSNFDISIFDSLVTKTGNITFKVDRKHGT